MTPDDFAAALLTLGDEFAAVAGRSSPTGSAVAALLACHEALAPPATWRHFSDLTPDGAPVELVERFGGDATLGLTLEPRRYAGETSDRFLAASTFAARLWEGLPTLLAELAPSLRNRLWIGFDEHGCDLYLPLGRGTASERVMAALGIRADGEARAALAAQSAGGRLVMLALALEAGRPAGVTLYLRQHRPQFPATLDFYPATALGRAHWDDPDTGSAVRLRLDGTLQAEALYHYTAAYWPSDSALLTRLADVLARRELPLGNAPLLAGLIGVSGHALHRRMIALSARPDGAHTRFKLYQSAVHYVRHHRSTSVPSRAA